jgi:transglutaminase superfamily protein
MTPLPCASPARSVTRIRAVRRGIEQPADVWLAMRMLAWALLLPVLARTMPLATLAPRLWRESRRTEARRAARVIVLSGAIYGRRRPLRDNCLVRSLLAYRFLAEADADPRLVVGVRPGRSSVDGHVWVTVRNLPVHESRASLQEFRPLVVFGRRGRAETLERPIAAR